MTFVRRFLVLAALFFWQGGFTFYASVVVPLGQEVFGPLEQGFLTRRVTNSLNLAGAVALPPLAWDVIAAPDPSPRRRRLRWLTWAGMALGLAVLVWLHPQLDRLLDPEALQVLERKTFRAGHRLYLWTSTVQWVCGLVYLGLTLAAWRGADRRSEAGS